MDNVRGLGRAARAAALLTIAVTALVFAGAAGASAAPAAPAALKAPAAPGAGPAKQINGKMTLNCTALDAAKRQYAVDHGYCPPVSDAEKGGGMGTEGVAYGDCGSSSIW